jgi:hypothetical protein
VARAKCVKRKISKRLGADSSPAKLRVEVEYVPTANAGERLSHAIDILLRPEASAEEGKHPRPASTQDAPGEGLDI